MASAPFEPFRLTLSRVEVVELHRDGELANLSRLSSVQIINNEQ
jgi:hypothetical protein